MEIKDRKHNITVTNLLSHKCLQRSCYSPQISFRNEEIEYVCGRRQLHGCPNVYSIKEENKYATEKG